MRRMSRAHGRLRRLLSALDGPSSSDLASGETAPRAASPSADASGSARRRREHVREGAIAGPAAAGGLESLLPQPFDLLVAPLDQAVEEVSVRSFALPGHPGCALIETFSSVRLIAPDANTPGCDKDRFPFCFLAGDEAV